MFIEAAQALVDVKAPENNPQSSVVDAHPTQPGMPIIFSMLLLQLKVSLMLMPIPLKDHNHQVIGT